MSPATATAEAQAAVNTEVKVYKPSDSLVKLAENIKTVAKFDPGIIPIFEQATRIAAVNQLLAAPEMANILDKLEGSPAGFPTDMKDGAKYPVKERNQAVTQGLSMGARLVNAEFMIIKSRAFLGKPYYRRMLDELGTPGTYTEACKYRMLWWDTEVGDIGLNGPIASCTVTINYKVEDKATGKELVPAPFTRKFSIRTFPTDTPDLWTGKFERRAWKKLLEFLAGVDFGEEGDEGGAAAPASLVPPPVGMVSLAKEAAPAAPATPPPAPATQAPTPTAPAGGPELF